MKKFGLLFILFVSIIKLNAQEFKNYGPGGGGCFYNPSINPSNNNDIFITSDNSNIFRSSDQGKNWSMYHFNKLRSTNQSKVCFTSDPKIMFTISNDFGADLFVPSKSTDGGTTWISLESDPTFGSTYYIFTDESVSNRIVLGSDYEVFYSGDGGTTFKSIYEGDILGTGGYISGAFFDGQRIIIGLGDGILESTDGVTNFTKNVTTGLGVDQFIYSMAGAKSGNNITLNCLTTDKAWVGIQGWDFPAFLGFYSMNYSMNKGVWTERPISMATGTNPYLISMSKSNPNIIYLAGTNSESNTPIVLKSTNGGVNFTDVFIIKNNQNIASGWAGASGVVDWTYGEMALGFSCSSNNPNTAVLTDYGFAYLTTDAGKSWRQIYTNQSSTNNAGNATSKTNSYSSCGIENSTVWGFDEVIGYSGYSYNKYVGTSDFGALNVNKDFNFFKNNGLIEKNVYRIISKSDNSDIYYAATSSVKDIYQEHYLDDLTLDAGTGKIIYTTNSGTNWQTLKDFGNPVVWIEIDKSNQNRMYASVVDSKEGGIYYCSDISLDVNASWEKLANPPRTAGHPFNIRILEDGSLICSYSGQRDASGNFTATSGVFLSSDNGKNWKDISDNGMKYWTKDIIVDKINNNVFYAAVCSGWGGASSGLGGVYKSTNRGTTWNRILDLDNIESISLHPLADGRMYVTTGYDGLWRTDNVNSSKPDFNQIENFPFEHPLRVSYNFAITTTNKPIDGGTYVDLLVTTKGNGYYIQENEYVTDVKEINTTESIKIYPNPATDFVLIENNFENEIINQIIGYDESGKQVYSSGEMYLNSGNSYKIKMNELKNYSNKFVIFKIITNNNTYYKKIIINK